MSLSLNHTDKLHTSYKTNKQKHSLFDSDLFDAIRPGHLSVLSFFIHMYFQVITYHKSDKSKCCAASFCKLPLSPK